MKWVLIVMWINGWGAPMQATTLQVPGFASKQLCANAGEAIKQTLRQIPTAICIQTE